MGKKDLSSTRQVASLKISASAMLTKWTVAAYSSSVWGQGHLKNTFHITVAKHA